MSEYPLDRVTAGDLDPRWEWCEIASFGDPYPVFIKARCNHLETVPVNASDWLTRELGEDGEIVARLCLTCDAQIESA